MTTFSDIQQLWNRQPAPAVNQQPAAVMKAAQKNLRTIRMNHFFTIGLLSVTTLILTWYFLVYTDFTFNRFFAGLMLMAGSLLLRIAAEYFSYRRFSRIDIRSDFTTYTKRITAFYSGRKKIHFYLTPLVLLLYAAGFVILLPIFRQEFSPGFYGYILVSGILFCCFFTWLITRHIKKELLLLDFLKGIKDSDTRVA
jgi:hypothetical protein